MNRSGLLKTTIILSSVVVMLCNYAWARDKKIDVCTLFTEDEIARLIGKKNYIPHQANQGCYWAPPGQTMAELHFGYKKTDLGLRNYFADPLPTSVPLIEVKGVGDRALMTVVEGGLGVIAARKGEYVVNCSVVFLDIKPGSQREALLFEFINRILDNLN